jgi:hypothetical protein
MKKKIKSTYYGVINVQPSADAGPTTRGRRLVNGQIPSLANRLHISPSKIIRRANIGPTISTQHGANVGMPTATFDQPYRPCTNVESKSCCWLGISSLVILCTCTYICESMLLFDDIWWCLFCTQDRHILLIVFILLTYTLCALIHPWMCAWLASNTSL